MENSAILSPCGFYHFPGVEVEIRRSLCYNVRMNYLFVLQSIREASPAFVNYFFLFVSEVMLKGAVVLVPVIYWCVSKHDGLAIGFSYIASYSINQTIKNIACVPRPWLRDSRLHVDALAKKGATGFSFPSGHTVTAASVFGGICVWQRGKKRIAVLCVIMIVLTAFSRNWLGCHTLADVLAAILVAAVSLCAVNLLIFWFSRHQDKDILICALGIIISAVILAAMTFKPYAAIENPYPLVTDCYTACGISCGMLLGWVMERRLVGFTTDVARRTKILRAVSGILVVVAVYLASGALLSFLGDHFAHLVKYFLVFFVIIFVHPLAFTLIERRRK